MSVNSLKWIYLGDIIEQRREKYSGIKLLPIRGVSKDGFIPPKQKDADLSKYNVFYKYDFVFNPARMELNSIALNIELPKGMCSSLYEIFSVDTTIVLPEYLNLFIKRGEFARLCEYIGSGSAREYCRVANISEIKVPVPIKNNEVDLTKQQELVDTYNGLKALAEQNEALIQPLTQSCQAYIVDCRKKYTESELGLYITELDERNSDGKFTIEDVKGISILKKLIPTKANMNGVSLSPYKLVRPNEFSYVTVTSRNGGKISLARNDSERTYIVSSSYKVFRSKNAKELLPEFLFLLISRSEFDRLSRFNSWGSARETFDWDKLCRVLIPLPPPEVQQAIINLYNCAEEAKKIATEARDKMQILCPALVQKAING
jgi:type I restriction enzyme S subunit